MCRTSSISARSLVLPLRAAPAWADRLPGVRAVSLPQRAKKAASPRLLGVWVCSYALGEFFSPGQRRKREVGSRITACFFEVLGDRRSRIMTPSNKPLRRRNSGRASRLPLLLLAGITAAPACGSGGGGCGCAGVTPLQAPTGVLGGAGPTAAPGDVPAPKTPPPCNIK